MTIVLDSGHRELVIRECSILFAYIVQVLHELLDYPFSCTPERKMRVFRDIELYLQIRDYFFLIR